jgi:hypothetical protein
MRLFGMCFAVLVVFALIGVAIGPPPESKPEGIQASIPKRKPAVIQASTTNSAPQNASLTQKITDPAHLALLREAIDSGGYNCSRIISASYSHEDSRGLNFSVACSTGIFGVSANRAGRVTAVTCRMLC